MQKFIPNFFRLRGKLLFLERRYRKASPWSRFLPQPG